MQKKLASAVQLTTLATAALLSACGGGDDAATPGQSFGGGSVPIQTAVPLPGYAAGSDEKLAFDHLNQARLNCGFGQLRHSAVLDTPATQHAGYVAINTLSKNPLVHPHLENPALPGYTVVPDLFKKQRWQPAEMVKPTFLMPKA